MPTLTGGCRERLPGCGVGNVPQAAHGAGLSPSPQPPGPFRCRSRAALVPPGSLRGRTSLPDRASPAARPSLTLLPRREAASTKRGTFFSVFFFFFPSWGVKNISAIDIEHRTRLRQSRGAAHLTILLKR